MGNNAVKIVTGVVARTKQLTPCSVIKFVHFALVRQISKMIIIIIIHFYIID